MNIFLKCCYIREGQFFSEMQEITACLDYDNDLMKEKIDIIGAKGNNFWSHDRRHSTIGRHSLRIEA